MLFAQVFYLSTFHCRRVLRLGRDQLATSRPIPRVGFNATDKTQEGGRPRSQIIGLDSNTVLGTYRQEKLDIHAKDITLKTVGENHHYERIRAII